MKLLVCPAAKKEVYRDFARVPEPFRTDKNGRVIKEGNICKITANSKSTYIILRGRENSSERTIDLDERKRNELGVDVGREFDFSMEPVAFFGELKWAWNSSDIAYRVVARLAVLSGLLGLLGFILGFLSLCKK